MLGKKRLITKLLCLALLCVGPLSITTQSEAPSPPAPGIEPLPPETYGTSCLFCWHVPVDDTGAPIPGVTGYTVQRSTDPDFVNVTTIDAGNNTSHNSTGLAYGSTYYWRVYARDANGNPQNMDPWDEITNPTGVRWSYITRTKCAIDPGPGGPGTPSLERITPPDPPNLCPIDGFYYLSSRNPAAQWSASAPVPVSFETVGGGEYFSIGLKADGTAWTWGINDNGQLGDGTTANSAVPLQVKGVGGSGYLTNVGAVYGGRRHALALMNDGTVFAWGNNSDGQLGNGTTVNSSTPVQVLGTGGSGFLSGVTAVCGAYVHSLALKADGTVWAWGKNNYGQLGDGTTISSTTPVQVKGPGGAGYLTNVVAIGQGAYHSLAVKADGTVWAWGNNQLNQLGDGTATHRYTPVQVKGPGGSGYLTNVSRVSGGNYHAVALKNDGTVWAWGYNNHGQLGNGTYTDSATPVQVKGALGVGYITNVNTIRGCFWGAAALKNDGTVWTWGYNTYGQLGNGTTADSTYPVKVKGPGGSGYITDAIALGGGYYHAAIVRQDRSPWAWGYNGYGQLGDGTATNRYYPTAVQYPETFSSGQIRARLSVVELRDAPGAFAEYPALEIESGDLSTQTNWNLPEGRYAMHVRAANNVNWSPWSAGALLAVDVTAPSLDLTEVTLMPDGALTAAATAGDNLSGVVKVVFAAKGETIEDTGAPYEAAWNTSSWNEGVYPVTAQAYDRAGNASAIAQQTITIDRTAPVTVHDYAHDGQWFNAPVVIQLTSTDNLSGVSATNYRIDGGETQTGTVFSFSAEGTHTVEYWAVDNAGNAEPVKTITIKLDMTAPTIETVVIPAPNGHGWHNVDPTVSFNAADGLSGLDTVTPETTVTTEGAAQNIAGMAVDLAGNSASTSVSINLDKTPPQIGNLQPADGSWINEPRPVISADLADAIAGIDIASATFILDGNQISENLTVLPDRIVYIPTADLAPGGHTFTVQATDQAGNSSAPAGATFHINPALPPLPPDPATVAPPLDRTSFTDLGAATSFLYTGANPIQTGVVPGTIEPRRAAVLRGKVLDCQGQPLPGVTVTIPDHPEFGQTVSRLDGMFDLAVNGGGPLTLRYQRDGYLTSQRQMEVAWQDYTLVSDVVLIQLDSQVTAVDLAAPGGQVARGSVVTDNDGTRQATLFFPEGVQALGLPGTLHVRATEYTVGENGPKAMPAELPPTSSYTYCVELSADEAMGTTVEFDRPLSFYVENFLDFPIGTRVPVGYYDYAKAAWIPSLDGRVIKVLGIDGGGLAELDVDGSGPATAQALAALGITEAERGKLAELYSPGQSIWRVQVAHFSPWDCNWPFGPPAGATGPQLAEGVAVAGCEDNSCLLTDKSTIEIQNQILRETIGIAGTPYTLNYASDRTSGRKAAYTVKIPVSEAQLPPGLKRIELEIRVAGKTYAETFAPLPNQTYTFTWDGKDAYGREMQGGHQAKVRIGYTYDAAYYSTQDGLANSFGTVSGLPITGSRARQEITLWEEYETPIGAWQTQAYSLGGWTLDVHHFYDPSGRVLYLGDGSRRSTKSISAIITTVAGMGMGGYAGDGVPATAAKLYYPSGVAIGPEGSIYITDQNRIRRVGPDGIITTIAGTGVGGYSGDGGPAREAKMTISHGVAIGPDGSIFISDTDNNRIRRVDPDGIITTIAGTGVAGYSGDGGPATAAMIDNPYGVAICPDGGIYISDYGNHRIRRVDPNGIITTIAGTGQQGYSGDAGPATEAMLSGPKGVAVGPDGSICIADSNNSRIRRVGPDGIITTIAGTGQQGYSGDGGPAIVAKLAWPVGVTFGPDGSIYIGDDFYWVRRISPDGIITTIAGTGVGGYSGDGGPATAAMLCRTRGVAVGPDGNLYIGDYSNGRIRRVSPALPGFTLGEYAIPSEDGSQIYRFDANGRHLDTKNVLTGTAVYTFRYNEEGVLQEIEDADGNLTVIERDLAGNPTAIIGPYGQRTSLVIDADGRLERVTNPASEIVDLGYVEGGLLNSLVDPRGGLHSFTYDAMGRLIRDEDPAGGVTSLEWEELTNGYLVRQREKTGESTEQFSTYQVENLRTGERRMTNQGCCGSPIVSVVSPNGTTTTTRPDGTIVTTIEGPDPRFGMQAPIAKSMTVTTPGGLTYTQTATRAVTLADPNNPLSVQTLTDTVTINGRTYTSTYDAAMRKITSTTPEGRQSFTTLDVKGRVVLVEVPGLAPVAFEYDTRGRLTTITEGTGIDARVSRINYNAQGFVESTTDPMERTTNFEYDLVGRVTAQIGPDGRRIPFTYDEHGNVTSITPPGKPAHTFTYTPVDLEETYNPPPVTGGGTNQTSYDYDLNRQLIQVTRPDGQTIGFEYDTMGRLVTVTVPGGEIGYVYDAATGNLRNIIAVDGGSLTYGYDGSLPTSVTWAGVITGSVGYGYDNSFRVTSQTVNGENSVTYQYDRDDLLTQAGAMTLSRDPQNGMLSGTTIGNVTDSYTYNDFGEVTDYAAQYAGADIYRVHQELDKLGRIISKTETVNGQTHTYEYTYDLAGRLTDVKKDGTLISHYDYDDNGNRLGYTGGGSSTTGTYDDQDRLLSYGGNTYEYTANGELLSKTDSSGTTNYVYDVLGNLTSVTLADGTLIQYLIDGQNRRMGKMVNGVLVQGFLYKDGLEPVAELDGSGNVVARYVYGARANIPDYMVKGGVTYRIVSDHLGSPRLVVDGATGQVAQRMDYDEFGNVIQDTNPGFQPFGFAGGIYSIDTGFVRFGARDYDAETGRWTVKDLIGFTGGDTELYDYCGNDPVNYYDALGLVRVKIGGNVFTIHAYDADTAYPHAHLYDTNQKVHLGTGNIYSGKTVVGNVGSKVLERLKSAACKAGVFCFIINIGDMLVRTAIIDQLQDDLNMIRQGKSGKTLQGKLSYVEWQLGGKVNLQGMVFQLYFINGLIDYKTGSQLVNDLYTELWVSPIKI